VIQFILEHGKPRDKALIVSQLRGHMFHLVRHKFASNVCEKALVVADSQTRHNLIEEMLLPKEGGGDPVLAMMKDHYASKG
jgi:pumilio RNA-binding family